MRTFTMRRCRPVLFGDRRVTVDAGQAVNENFAARLNMMYEKADTFRDYENLQRYGINPTFTFWVDDDTKVKLSYEYFHDNRTADRGNPSQALSAVPPSSTRFNPAAPFAPNGDLTAFFGSPTLNTALANVQTGMAFIEHDFPQWSDGEKWDTRCGLPKILPERLPRQWAVVGGGEFGRHFFQLRGLPAHNQSGQRFQPNRLYVQGCHGPGVSHAWVRNRVWKTSWHRCTQHWRFSKWHLIRPSAIRSLRLILDL